MRYQVGLVNWSAALLGEMGEGEAVLTEEGAAAARSMISMALT